MPHCIRYLVKPLRGAVLLLGATTMVAGCSSLSDVPTWAGGLPADAPARPTVDAPFPAVHDVPPPRNERTLTDDQQVRLEKDLAAARERVSPGSGQAAAAAAKKTAPRMPGATAQ